MLGRREVKAGNRPARRQAGSRLVLQAGVLGTQPDPRTPPWPGTRCDGRPRNSQSGCGRLGVPPVCTVRGSKGVVLF